MDLVEWISLFSVIGSTSLLIVCQQSVSREMFTTLEEYWPESAASPAHRYQQDTLLRKACACACVLGHGPAAIASELTELRCRLERR